MSGTVEGSRVQRMGTVIVGGGITGLSAAWRLVRNAEASGASLPIRLLEARSRVGGLIRTERIDGMTLEAGPDSIVTHKPSARNLCEQLGLDDRLIFPEREDGRTQIAHAGRLFDVPRGFAMVGPSQLGPMLRSPLFGPLAKLRMLCEPFVPRADAEADESLRGFVTRRFGREAFERVAEPVLANLFTADGDRMSVRVNLPRFRLLEQEHGSLSRAFRVAARRAPEPRPPAFFTLRDGLSTLVERLAEELPAGLVQTGTTVTAVEYDERRRLWKIQTDSGATILAEAVILAAPSHVAAGQLRGFDADLASDLAQLDYASCVTVSLVYPRSAPPEPIDSFGFFAPRTEGLPVLAGSNVSVKFAGHATNGRLLTRTFIGGALDPDRLELDDEELTRISHETLSRFYGLRGAPEFSRVHRHPRSMPQFPVGDARRLERVRRRVRELPGLSLCGGATGAIGIPDCVRSGERAADRVVGYLARRVPGLELAM